MRKGFTLIELLVVIGIMGLLGTLSVGGYRAMQRGMAERGVMENVNSFIRAAYQRAQIDRQPTVVYFWNETLRAANDDNDKTEIVIGKAVAVRRYGRLTAVTSPYLYDEFADHHLTFQTDDDENGGSGEANTMFLYPIDKLSDAESSGNLRRSAVHGKVYRKTLTPIYLSTENGMLSNDGNSGQIETYAFQIEDDGGVNWEAGMAYGFEFASFTLPHNYIFGSSYSSDAGRPVQGAGTLVFDVGRNEGSGSQGGVGSRSTIQVSSLRPSASGTLSAEKVGTSEDPTRSMK